MKYLSMSLNKIPKNWSMPFVLLISAIACFAMGATRGDNTAEESHNVIRKVTNVSAEANVGYQVQAIETIRVGQKVWLPGVNPSGERDVRFGETIDASQWRKMTLRAPKGSGNDAQVEMLRPKWWLDERDVKVGGKVDIEVPECGIDGLADVLSVDACPPIREGPGRTVTATFHHQSSAVIDVAIEGLEKPIGTTANHPFWSETKQEFVRADKLKPGELVRTSSGTSAVKSIFARGPPEPVFNLEVHVDHMYCVHHQGVLVHNGGPCPKQVESLQNGPNNTSVSVKTKAAADRLLNAAFPDYQKVKGVGSQDASGVRKKRKMDRFKQGSAYHKDYSVDPTTGHVRGHELGNAHGTHPHINIKRTDGKKVIINVTGG